MRATVDNSSWDLETMLVSSPLRSAVNGNMQYIEQTTAEMKAQSGGIDFDLSQLLEDKERINNEEERHNRSMKIWMVLE